MAEEVEKRQSKLEDAITKLTEISADLNKMIAVHELRISQQEKLTDSLEIVLEKRRDEIDARMREIYDHIEEEDKSISHKIDESFEKLSQKISNLEKMMWVYGGAFTVLAFTLANWGDLLKLFKN